ncbi:microtubule-associated tumor suppressor 1 homolog isoform X1 [Brachyistius frenatus]|uniref:microtubule-associated tumor suppressor 1 homolog isoform X1 n=1 Tax=Brachyistius frenatus TaxID=100188 RepID=UPI0037E7B9E7
MSVPESAESFPVRATSSSTMKLPLHTAGDHNGNAFLVSSSSSSSSSCESSPESLRSLSSLSGGRTDSPLDYDMLEVTLMTTAMKTDAVTVVDSNWESKADEDDVSAGKLQTAPELSESNDNSVSVYVDADGGEYRCDSWNDNLTLALSLTTSSGGHGNTDDLSSRSSNGGRHGSSSPDSDVTEIPADDDDDDEEESLFLSVSSDMGERRSSVKPGTAAVSGAAEERSEVTCPLDLPADSQAEPAASEDLSESTQLPFSTPPLNDPPQGAERVASPSPDEARRRPEVSKPTESSSNPPASQPEKTKPSASQSTARTAVSNAVKPASLEAKRASKLDLQSVKAKVGSRSNTSPLKTPSQQNKTAPANGKRAAPRKEEVQTGDGGKKQRSLAGPVKVAVVLKPSRGRSVRASRQTAAADAAQPGRKSVEVSHTFSTSTSSLVSEAVEDRPPNTPRKAVRDVPEKPGAPAESEEEQRKSAGEASEVAVERPRRQSRKVSSKLGPAARQPGGGLRLERGPPGAAPPPGSWTGPPGPGSPGARQTEGCTSPTGARPGTGQNQGIPKPRTNAASAGAAMSISKPAANQQSGSPGRPAAPAASKLPVKGLPTSLSSSSLGSSENNGATNKASPGAPAPAGTRPDERLSRSTLPVGSQSLAKPPCSGSPCDPVSSANSAVSAAQRPLAMRSRALSLQARTTATGLKAPTVTAAKTAAHQALAKLTTQNPLQRSGSARLSRLSGAVDKNKPREAPARPTNTSSSQTATTGAVTNQQLVAPDLIPDVVNGNSPAAPALPAPAATTTATSGPTVVSGLNFKVRTGSRSSPKTGSRLQNASRPGVAGTVVVDGTKQNQSKEQSEKKNQAINQLRKLLVQGNRRVEALATVIQHVFTEREEALKQKKELSLELSNLREELVASSQCCERLRKEKEEARVGLEEAFRRLEAQQKEELVQLEDRLRSFYQTEWDKVHQTYQEEADKCRVLMEQQVEELRSRQETERKNQEVSHSQDMESLKQHYESSQDELKSIQQTDLQNLQRTLKETETSLSEKISELSAEKDELNEKLRAEEERRKILADKNLKDSHTVYLEQELESLKVVLEIKNNHLHQKDKKLMEMEKMLETNVKLEECMKKVQQENEDYKARMDKHAALSRQLSSEQAILQQTLQKESKVNKRLSMENEELLWKLHNGDLLASPRRLSPTSPFGSPRNSASFPTAAPLSPR